MALVTCGKGFEVSNPIEIHAYNLSVSTRPGNRERFLLTDGRTLTATVERIHEYAYTVSGPDAASDILTHGRYLWFRDVAGILAD
jgi:hypothetical protein